ncbi:MAG: caspase family protein, partial [Beijerinckiaceae bacterium]
MKRTRVLSLVLGATAALCAYSAAWAETRLGLVVGNSGYPALPLKTAVNDAALVGETLRQLGFDVSEGRDLDQTSLRRLVRDFAAKVEATDGDAVVYVYLAGHGIQAAAKNHFVPVDARIMRPADVPAEALSVDALLQELVNQKVKARFVVLDSATKFPGSEAAKLAPGLAALNPAPQALVAAAASAGEIMPPQSGDYGVYALALTKAMREPGLTADEVFSRVTLQVHQETKGAVTPVQVSTLAQPFMFLERAPDAPPPPRVARDPRATPFRELDAATAYAVAIERNTLKDYREFLSVFPNDPLAAKIKARMAQRREALAWQKANRKKTREAYWTYRKFYPRGLHFEEAGLELVELGAPLRAPPDFEVETWEEFEPPPPEELAYYEEIIEQPGRYRDILPPPPPPMLMPRGPGYDYIPPPPPPPSGPGMLPLIGLGALGAAAIVPRIVRRPPPRSEAPAISPRQPLPPPSIVTAPPPAGPRSPGAGAGL